MFKYLFVTAIKKQNRMMNCQSKVSYRRDKLPYHNWVKFHEYRAVLEDNLRIKKHEANEILFRQQEVFKISKEHLAQQCQHCLKYGIHIETLCHNAKLLRWPKQTLQNRVTLLRELGAEYLEASWVSNFHQTMNLSITVFKGLSKIPKTTSVTENLLRSIDETAACDPPLKILNDDLSVKELQARVMKWYFQWKLKIPEEDVKSIKRTMTSLKLKSFTIMKEMYNILHHDVGMTREEIIKYSCLGTGSPEDLRRIINEIQTFYGVDIKMLIRMKPLLHKMDYNNVKLLMECLKRHGYEEKAILRHPEIFVTPHHVVVEKLEKLKNTPELNVFRNSKKSVQLIVNFDKAQTRSIYLRYMNIRNSSVRTLTEQKNNFERFVKTGVDRTKSHEITDAFEKLLKLDPDEIRRKLKKHPYWSHIDLVTMEESLHFLLKRFTPEDLHDNLQLILYPREKIAEVLDSLSESKETSGENVNQRYSSKQILALCLYEIEREHHFSGDGIWKKQDLSSKKIAPVENSYRESLSDDSDYDSAESEVADKNSEKT